MYFVFIFRYFKCNKAQTHFCPGSIKKLLDETIVIVRPHNGHERDLNNRNLIYNFRNVLKQRAAEENNILKNIYDEEARR